MQLNNLKNNIAQIINNSNLPIDAVYYVMKDIMNELTTVYNRQIEIENAAAAQSEADPGSEISEPAVAADDEKKEE